MELDHPFSLNLDEMQTQWSLLRKAHHGSQNSAADARNSLVLRYAPAIRGYIRALTGNEFDADELSQEVVVRLLKGDFSGADPNQGRFRDFMKAVVRNMVRDHWKRAHRREKSGAAATGIADFGQPAEEATSPHHDDAWMDQWRNNLIDLGMSRLQEHQTANPGNLAYTVMQLRSSFPELDSAELADRLSRLAGREINAANCRQHLKRARVRFAEFIVQEIADGLDTTTVDQLQEELIAVGLYQYVRDVLPAVWVE